VAYVKSLPRNVAYRVTIGDKEFTPGDIVDLTAAEQKELSERGFYFEKSSKSEASEAADQPVVGEDVFGSDPPLVDVDQGPANYDQGGE
jgi:hypothetical protein